MTALVRPWRVTVRNAMNVRATVYLGLLISLEVEPGLLDKAERGVLVCQGDTFEQHLSHLYHFENSMFVPDGLDPKAWGGYAFVSLGTLEPHSTIPDLTWLATSPALAKSSNRTLHLALRQGKRREGEDSWASESFTEWKLFIGSEGSRTGPFPLNTGQPIRHYVFVSDPSLGIPRDRARRLVQHLSTTGANSTAGQKTNEVVSTELIEMAAAVGNGARAMVKSLAQNPIKMIQAGNVPLVSHQVAQRLLAQFSEYLAPSLSDALAGAPPNTESGGNGFGSKTAGPEWDAFSFREEFRRDRGPADETGVSEKATYPGLLGAKIVELLETETESVIDLVAPEFAALITATLNFTLPWRVRSRVVSCTSRRAAANLYAILSRTIHREVSDKLVAALSVSLTDALVNVVTNTVTRGVTHAVTAALQATFEASSRPSLRAHGQAKAYNYAMYFGDYFSPNQATDGT